MPRVSENAAIIIGLEKANLKDGVAYWTYIAASNCPWLQVGPVMHRSLEDAIEFFMEHFRECIEYFVRYLRALEAEEIERIRRMHGEHRAKARARLETD